MTGCSFCFRGKPKRLTEITSVSLLYPFKLDAKIHTHLPTEITRQDDDGDDAGQQNSYFSQLNFLFILISTLQM